MTSATEIPVFPMWKMFGDTMQALLNAELSESSIGRLANIIKAKEFSNIFVYDRDPTISFDEYQIIANKYQSFSTWLLGRFFYLLNCEKLGKSHAVITQAQLCILAQLSKTQLHVFTELSNEYGTILEHLTTFHKNDDPTVVLKPFVPKVQVSLDELALCPIEVEVTRTTFPVVLSKTVQIVGFILRENFRFHSFLHTVPKLDSFLTLLEVGPAQVQLEICDIFTDLIGCNNYDHEIAFRTTRFCGYFEQIVNLVFGGAAAVFFNRHDKQKFEAILIRFINGRDDRKLLNFILNQSLDNSDFKLSIESQISLREAAKNCEIQFDYNNVNFYGNLIENECILAMYTLRQVIVQEVGRFLIDKDENQPVDLFEPHISEKWAGFSTKLMNHFNQINCGNSNCEIERFLHVFNELIDILVEIKIKHSQIWFFNEFHFVLPLLIKLNHHFGNCPANLRPELYMQLIAHLPVICFTNNADGFFNMLLCAFIRSVLPPGEDDIKRQISTFCKLVGDMNLERTIALHYGSRFIENLCSGLVGNLNKFHLQRIANGYFNVCKEIIDGNDEELQILVIRSLPIFLGFGNGNDAIFTSIFMPAFKCTNRVVREAVKILPNIVCLSSSIVTKKVVPKRGGITVEFMCHKCQHGSNEENRQFNFDSSLMLKQLIICLSSGDEDIKIAALEALPSFSSHMLKFHSENVAFVWLKLCGDESIQVSKKFAGVISTIIRHCQENPVLSEPVKNDLMNMILSTILNVTKDSLIQANYALQEALLQTIEQISDFSLLPVVKILLYFIMTPTSKHYLIAINRFFGLAKKHKYSPMAIFKQFKTDICEIIVHLCCVNYALIRQNLATSLDKLAVTFEFYGAKDFVRRESRSLLPFFVTKTMKTAGAVELMEEMAAMADIELAELLATKYGQIFVHCFLNEEPATFKKCMDFIEAKTGLRGPVLRKKNFRVILNELLLSFHEKRDKVLLTLSLLMREDVDVHTSSVQEYLQPRLLGLLQHFDFKLMAMNSNSNMILLGLADLVRFMGPKHVGPVRFKIIAMLRTANCDSAQLSCEVWDAFIRSCEIETLGPQLATVCISIFPLLHQCPGNVNEMLTYLIVNNETHLKDYIKDLFFLNESLIDCNVNAIISKYTKFYEDCSLKDKLRFFLKYLTHETMEVKIKAFEQVKIYMGENREELDHMILGYNGIDSILVELIDILMLGCREKDEALKLACGELIGELGAIEPSHLPRRLAQNGRSFTFYINDDIFIINVLNELARAFQGETNTYGVGDVDKVKDIAVDAMKEGLHVAEKIADKIAGQIKF